MKRGYEPLRIEPVVEQLENEPSAGDFNKKQKEGQDSGVAANMTVFDANLAGSQRSGDNDVKTEPYLAGRVQSFLMGHASVTFGHVQDLWCVFLLLPICAKPWIGNEMAHKR
jgi:hypothetical protein